MNSQLQVYLTIGLIYFSAVLAFGVVLGFVLARHFSKPHPHVEPPQPSPAPPAPPVPPPAPIPKPQRTIEEQVRDYLNEVRARYGLAPVELHPKLCEAARKLALGMAAGHMRPHEGWPQRLEAVGFPTFLAGKQNVSEGNAQGQPTPQECIDSLNSEDDGRGHLGGHTKDIRSADWKLIGVAYAHSDSGWKHFWVIEYAGAPGEVPAQAVAYEVVQECQYAGGGTIRSVALTDQCRANAAIQQLA